MSAFRYAGEEAELTVDGLYYDSFTISSNTVQDLDFEPSLYRKIYTLPTPLSVPAGTDITIGTAGTAQFGLQGVVIGYEPPPRGSIITID